MHSPYQVTPQTRLHSGLRSGWVFQKNVKVILLFGSLFVVFLNITKTGHFSRGVWIFLSTTPSLQP